MSAAIEPRQPTVVEGEIVNLADVMPRPLQYPPAVRPRCACGKDGSPEAHGAIGGRRPFSCGEILEIAARVEAGRRPAARWRWLLPVHGRHVAQRWARRAAVVVMSFSWSAANPGSTIDPGTLSAALALPQALGGYATPNSCGNCGRTLTPSGTCTWCDRPRLTPRGWGR